VGHQSICLSSSDQDRQANIKTDHLSKLIVQIKALKHLVRTELEYLLDRIFSWMDRIAYLENN